MVLSVKLTSYLTPRQHVLQLGTGVVAIPKEGVYPPNVSKVWNVALDGSLEASLSGPLNLTIKPYGRTNELTFENIET